jgi:hypothetical protein
MGSTGLRVIGRRGDFPRRWNDYYGRRDRLALASQRGLTGQLRPPDDANDHRSRSLAAASA